MEYRFPKLEFLQGRTVENQFTDKEYVEAMKAELDFVLKSFGVKAKIVDVRMSPFAVMFDVRPEEGVSVRSIKNLHLDLELHMAAPIEIVNVGETQYTVGISVKQLYRPLIGLREVMESDAFTQNDFKLPIAAGMDVLGKPFCFDLAATPHLLVAGTTGSGKSVFLNDIILSILYTKSPDEVQFVMIDPKMVELGCYNGIPHLMAPVAHTSHDAFRLLQKVDQEMMRRYQLFAEHKVKKLESYNELVSKEEQLPQIVVLIDEYMEMMFEAPKRMEELVARLARLARAAGIHLIMATQRPSSDVITGSIKANIPCRASFTVIDWRESKTILDRTGAERLLGSGDMLYSSGDTAIPVHAQASYVSDFEVDWVVGWIKGNTEEAE